MSKTNWCYDPKPDITTFELAKAFEVVIDAMQQISPESSSAWPDAQRHFREAAPDDGPGLGSLYQPHRARIDL